MIPRLRPYFNLAELLALLKNNAEPAAVFEKRFAEKLGVRFALAFPYMRSALTTVLKAHNIKDSEVITPAFTCVVVPNAVVVSLNTPRFVDINPTDYNLDLGELEAKITPRTKAVIATHMFGAPLDLDRLAAILKERPDILVIQDCALALSTTYKGKPIWEYNGITMFSFSIGKHISALEGGAVVTNDEALYRRIKQFRDDHFAPAGPGKSLGQILFLIEILGGLNKLVYGLVQFLAEKTSLLDSLSVYYDEERVYLPEDYQTFSPPFRRKWVWPSWTSSLLL